MENHQDILQFIYINTDRASKQVSTLSHGVVAPPFKSYLQELAQKYKQLGQTAEKHLTCTNTKATENNTTALSTYMDIEQQTAGSDDSDIAELLMQHSVLGIVQIKKQVRACQNRENFPHNFYDLLLELLDTEQFNLRCLQAFL